MKRHLTTGVLGFILCAAFALLGVEASAQTVDFDIGRSTPAVETEPPELAIVSRDADISAVTRVLSVYDQLDRSAIDAIDRTRLDVDDLEAPPDIRTSIAVPAEPERPPADITDSYPTWVKIVYGISQGTVWGTYGTDMATTHKGVELGASEGNLLLRKKDGTPSYVLKTAMVTAESFGSHHLLYKRGQPGWAIAANAGTSFAQGWASVHNFTNINRLLERAGTGLVLVPARKVAVGYRF